MTDILRYFYAQYHAYCARILMNVSYNLINWLSYVLKSQSTYFSHVGISWERGRERGGRDGWSCEYNFLRPESSSPSWATRPWWDYTIAQALERWSRFTSSYIRLRACCINAQTSFIGAIIMSKNKKNYLSFNATLMSFQLLCLKY